MTMIINSVYTTPVLVFVIVD